MSQVKFYYSVEKLFDKIKLESMYRASGIKIGDRMNFEDYAVEENDLAFITRLLKKGSKEVFSKISALARDITNAYQFMEADLSSSPSYDESGYIVMFITQPTHIIKVSGVDTATSVWDANISEIMDGNIEEALINYVLKEWFKRKKVEYMDIEEDYKKNLNDIKSNTMARIRPLKKKYNTGF